MSEKRHIVRSGQFAKVASERWPNALDLIVRHGLREWLRYRRWERTRTKGGVIRGGTFQWKAIKMRPAADRAEVTDDSK